MKKISILYLLSCLLIFSNNLFAQKSEIKYQYPTFPGGVSAMAQYFADNLHLPQTVLDGKEGYVSLTATINKNGEVENPFVRYSFNDACNEEALRAVSSMPKWDPYIKNHQIKSKELTILVPFFIPRDKNFQFKRAQYYLSQKKYNLAYITAQMAVSKDSLNFEVYKLMNEICLKNEDPENGCDYLYKGVLLDVKGCTEIYDLNCKGIVKKTLKELNAIKKNTSKVVIANWDEGEITVVNHIIKTTKYPAPERENNIQGKVMVTFVIDEEGNVIDADIYKGVSPGLDRESLRVISSLPKAKPASKDGINVPTRFYVPVLFKMM